MYNTRNNKSYVMQIMAIRALVSPYKALWKTNCLGPLEYCTQYTVHINTKQCFFVTGFRRSARIHVEFGAPGSGSAWIQIGIASPGSGSAWIHIGFGFSGSGSTWIHIGVGYPGSGSAWIHIGFGSSVDGKAWIRIRIRTWFHIDLSLWIRIRIRKGTQ
jgi:hypothetical protein